MARFVIATVLMALIVYVSAVPRRGGYRRYNRFDCSTCFTAFGDYGVCASLYNNGAACGSQGVKSRRREYVTGANADCHTKCKYHGLIDVEECLVDTPIPCIEGVECDFTDGDAVLPICANQAVPLSNQYTLSIPTGASSALTLDNSQVVEGIDAYGYYFAGPFEASATTPHHFCLQMTYQLPRNVVLKVLKLPGDFTTGDDDTAIRHALLYHDHDHHYIIKDSRSTDMLAEETVSKSFEAEQGYKIGIVAFPPSGTLAASVKIVTTYSINEGDCPSTTTK